LPGRTGKECRRPPHRSGRFLIAPQVVLAAAALPLPWVAAIAVAGRLRCVRELIRLATATAAAHRLLGIGRRRVLALALAPRLLPCRGAWGAAAPLEGGTGNSALQRSELVGRRCLGPCPCRAWKRALRCAASTRKPGSRRLSTRAHATCVFSRLGTGGARREEGREQGWRKRVS
jgi:hypothetical protein